MLHRLANLIDVAKWLLVADADSYIIYQPGKVGSSSVERALEAVGKNVMHVHQLRSHEVQFLPESRLSKTKKLRAAVFLAVTAWAFRRSKASVIVIVREPVSHLMSLTFHHLDKILFLYFQKYADTRAHLSFANILDRAHREVVNINYASDWLDKDFLPLTRMDTTMLADQPFSQAVEHAGRRYLFLRFENLENSRDTLSAFVMAERLDLENFNDSSRKWYASLYQEAKDDYVLAPDLEMILKDGCYAKTFYG